MFAEVHFYFLLEDAAEKLVPYALVSTYGPPNTDITITILLSRSPHFVGTCLAVLCLLCTCHF
jgi:hypothetical protein